MLQLKPQCDTTSYLLDDYNKKVTRRLIFRPVHKELRSFYFILIIIKTLNKGENRQLFLDLLEKWGSRTNEVPKLETESGYGESQLTITHTQKQKPWQESVSW